MNGHERQKEQSRQMIENAFFELLREKEFSQITVSEIVKRADVARRTFYRLYEKKESVIAVYFQNLCEEYKNGHAQIESYDLKQVAKDYFEFWYTQRDKLLAFYRAGLQDLLYYPGKSSLFPAEVYFYHLRIFSEFFQAEAAISASVALTFVALPKEALK